MKLLLFDVDLTLIDTGGAGSRAMKQTFEQLFDVRNGLQNISFMGRTDRAIFKEAMQNHDLFWREESENKFKQNYFQKLKAEIKKSNSKKRILPGVPALLNMLSDEDDVTLALLTGNWVKGAEIKLQHFNLFHFFEFGAFGDDSEFREELPQFAAERFTKITGNAISPDNVFIIGDTPLDVACARPFGAKSIAVATGFSSIEQLEAAKPDFLLKDLSDSEKFLNMIGGKL